MGYALKAHERVSDGIRRVADEQIDRAIIELTDPAIDRHTGIHEARKRFKQIRSVLRLVRYELGPVYAIEQTRFGAIGRQLSDARDAQVLVETCEKLRQRNQNMAAADAFLTLRAVLAVQRDELVAHAGDLNDRLGTVVDELQRAKRQVVDWPLARGGFAMLRPGLEWSYRRGRIAFNAAYTEPNAEHVHTWRKRVKDHWYHHRLLRHMWPEVIRGYQQSLNDLADLLGDDNDLAVLQHVIDAQQGLLLQDHDRVMVLDSIKQRQAELRAAAAPLGQRIFAEKPKRLSKRLHTLWVIWRDEAQHPADEKTDD